MMSFNNNEAECVELFRDIKKCVSAGDYHGVLPLIERAIYLSKKIVSETNSLEKKKKWQENINNLSNIYSDCQIKLGNKTQEPVNVDVVPKEKVIKEKVKVKKNDNIQKDKDTTKLSDDLFIVNNIDVRQFLIKEANSSITFDDVYGMDYAKEVIENEFFLTDEDREYNESIGRSNKTFLLLYGVPGTGKTHFAKAISNEFKNKIKEEDVPFFAVACSQIKDCKVGASEKNIEAIFDFAKQFKRCILFFDDFECLVPSRNIETGDPTAKSNVQVFLTATDGYNSHPGTLIIAATNYPEQIDSALDSRIQERILVPLPSKEAIYFMLNTKLGNQLPDYVNLKDYAEKLIGYSSRDITKLINKIKDMFFKYYRETKNKDTKSYPNVNEMLDEAITIIKPSTKEEDLERIKSYNQKY